MHMFHSWSDYFLLFIYLYSLSTSIPRQNADVRVENKRPMTLKIYTHTQPQNITNCWKIKIKKTHQQQFMFATHKILLIRLTHSKAQCLFIRNSFPISFFLFSHSGWFSQHCAETFKKRYDLNVLILGQFSYIQTRKSNCASHSHRQKPSEFDFHLFFTSIYRHRHIQNFDREFKFFTFILLIECNGLNDFNRTFRLEVFFHSMLPIWIVDLKL